jgi:hypothetical protein
MTVIPVMHQYLYYRFIFNWLILINVIVFPMWFVFLSVVYYFIPVYDKINVKQSLHYKEIEFQIFIYLQVKYWDLQEDTCTYDIYESTPEEIVNDFKEGTLKCIGTYCYYYLYFKKYFIWWNNKNRRFLDL